MKFYNPYEFAVPLTVQNTNGESYTIKPMPRTQFELLEGYSITVGSAAQYPNIQILPQLNINIVPAKDKKEGDK